MSRERLSRRAGAEYSRAIEPRKSGRAGPGATDHPSRRGRMRFSTGGWHESNHVAAGGDFPMPEHADGGRLAGPAIATGADDAIGGGPGRMSRVRWVICALLFFATTINYIDRGVLGVLEPGLRQTIKWTKTQYGDI